MAIEGRLGQDDLRVFCPAVVRLLAHTWLASRACALILVGHVDRVDPPASQIALTLRPGSWTRHGAGSKAAASSALHLA